jgi:hypothetical protein
MSSLTPGTVLVWNGYEYPDDPKSAIKPFWFVVLGDTGLLDEPIYLLLIKSTTQLHYYESTGSRAKHPVIRLPEFNEYGFDKECLLDFGSIPIEKTLNEVQRKMGTNQIEIKGKLPLSKLKDIYSMVHSSRVYSYMHKCKIKNSLNRSGLSGLQEPQKPKRR